MQELEQQFRQTFEDQTLSRAERKMLKQLLQEEALDKRELGVLRAKLFAIAREEMESEEDRKILEWVRKANNLLKPQSHAALSEVYFSPGDDCLHAIQDQIREARNSIDICVFTISDNRITDVILQAHRRGRRIRLLTDNDKMYDRGSDIEQMEEAGIDIRVDQTDYHMHHKFAVFDRKRVITGSYNWTRSAAEYNEENLIVTNNPAMVSEFTRQFDRMWDTVGEEL